MRLPRTSLIVRLAALGWALSGCSGKSEGTDAGPPDSGPAITCQNDSRVAAYTAGMSVASSDGTLHFQLMQGDPAPPARGTNTWTVKVTDAGGSAATGLALEVVPFMPDHGHGSSVKPTVTGSGDGTYRIDNLYFFMPGVWRITLTANEADGGAGPSGEFLFCVPG